MKISLVNKANSADLEQELSWFRQVIDTRLKLHFGQESNHLGVFDLKPPEFGESASNWANFLRRYQPSMIERLTILLALAPSIAPRILDIFLVKNAQIDDYFTEFGGLVQPVPRGFSPTRETLFFLVGGERLDLRFETMQLFQADHYFWTDNILSSPTPSLAAPAGSPILGVSTSFLENLTHTKSQTDVLESHFAVQKIQTKLAWEDLELLPRTINQLKDIENWLSHGDTLLNDWGLAGRLSTAFLALFHGVPGTGKRMVAGLLGKSIDIPVYKVNSPMLVSTYIGETEKNLAHLFDLLDQKKCILFFDEADALFGKRTNIQSAESRYINQAMAYLLHKLENVSGVAILAFENKMNLDQNFIRRFQASIDFPMPDSTQRLRIWQREIPTQATLAADINLTPIAQKFELSRGSIINIIRNVSIKALSKGSNEITATDLKQGIHQELSRIGSIQ